MKSKTVLTMLVTIIILLAAAPMPITSQTVKNRQDNIFSISDLRESHVLNHVATKLSFVSQTTINVANIEELYSAINRPTIVPTRVILAPGVYMLSAMDSNQMPRPNGGRIDLKQDMSIQGVEGDRTAVIIDAINLPSSSYEPDGLPNTGAVRMGRGNNAVEWLTVRNAVNGIAGIETDISTGATSFVRIAHVVSTGNPRGIDIRSFGMAMAGRRVVAQIVDNDLFDNQISPGFAGKQGIRIVTVNVPSAVMTVEMSNNRSHNNQFGIVVENNGTSNATISVTSMGDRFYQNGLGASIGGGFSLSSQMASNNKVNFSAYGSSFENNDGANDFERGGFFVFGGQTYAEPMVVSNNSVEVSLRNCIVSNNQFYDLSALGASSEPETIGYPGTNNRATVNLYDTMIPVLVTRNSIPMFRRDGNIARVFNFSTTKQTP